MTIHITIAAPSGSVSLVPIFAAIGAITAAAIAAYVALRMHRQTVLVETVTAERAQWRTDLRKETSSLASLVRAGVIKGKIAPAAFHKNRMGILLRINPAGRTTRQPVTGGHNLDRSIDMSLRMLRRAVDARPQDILAEPTSEAVLRYVEQLEDAVQELLKQEWEVSKREAVTGRLESSRKAEKETNGSISGNQGPSTGARP